MKRIDNSIFLLYIEPKAREKSKEPVKDELTALMAKALSKSKKGAANWMNDAEPKFRAGVGFKGFHRTDCGVLSSNYDYLLKNGMITNSLCVYYLKYYRNSIPETEIEKLKKLCIYYRIEWDSAFFENKRIRTKNK